MPVEGKSERSSLCHAHLPVAATIICAALASSASAAPYHDASAFNAALPGPTATVGFETPAANATVTSGTSIGHVKFNYTINDYFSGSPRQMKIISGLDTTSGSQGLGLDDAANFDQFFDGSSFGTVFDSPVLAVGLYVISDDPLLAGDVTLEAGGESLSNSDTPYATFPDGGEAHFLGIVSSTTAFSSATLSTSDTDDPSFFFRVDDLATAVPEPTAAVLLGLTALLVCRPHPTSLHSTGTR